MNKVILDCETRGTKPHNFNQKHPDFEVLFNGWKHKSKYWQNKDQVLTDGAGLWYTILDSDLWYLVGHNIKFDYKCLLKQNVGLPTNCKFFDTQIAQHFLNENLGEKGYKLESLAGYYKDWPYPHYKNLIDFENTDYWEPEHKADLLLYNKFDLDFTDFLEKKFEPQLKALDLLPLFNMVMDYTKVLSHVELNGVAFDLDELAKQKAIYSHKETQLLKDLDQFPVDNWESHPQIRKYLISEGVTLPLTPKGNPSVSKDVLATLDHPAAKAITAYRRVCKELHTYIEGTEKLLVGDIYYTNYKQTVTPTGRGTERFAQVWPRKDTSEFKKCIISKFPGGKLLACDWGQQEVRLVAERSKDPNLMKQLKEGFDLHDETLKRFSFIPNRTRAKNAVFNAFFFGQWRTLCRLYGFNRQQAEGFLEDLLGKRYPVVREWHNQTVRDVRNNVPIKSLVGRIRRNPTVTQAVNFPIQSTASEFNKIMTIILSEHLEGYQSHIVLDIHDELVIDLHPEEEIEVVATVKNCYEKCFYEVWHNYFGFDLQMNYPVEMKLGKTLWDVTKLIEKEPVAA